MSNEEEFGMEDLVEQAMEVTLEYEEEKSSDILKEYYSIIDPKLRKMKWGYKPSKSVDFGKTDQSLLNHIRNGVTFLSQLQRTLTELDRDFSDSKLRKSIALFVVHDIHKLRTVDGAEEEFNVDKRLVTEIVEDSGLEEFCDLNTESYYSAVKASHKSWNAKIARSPEFGNLSPFVRLADSIASSPTPEDAASSRSQKVLEEKFTDLEFRHHQLREEKGVLTNIINRSISQYMKEKERPLLTIYSDGCLYITEKEKEEIEIDEEVFKEILGHFMDDIKEAHDNFSNPIKLSDSITGGRLGSYNASPEYYFYAGLETISKGFVVKGIGAAESDNRATDSMISDIQTASEISGIEIEEGRKVIGYGRIVATFYKEILSEEMGLNDGLEVLGEIFNAEDSASRLQDISDEQDSELTTGGKWNYSLPIAQEFLDSEIDGKEIEDFEPVKLAENLSERLLDKISEQELEEELMGEFQKEIKAYLSDLIVLNATDHTVEQPDVFDEYTGKSRSKVCNICNRSTFGNKGDMETNKSDTGLQSGFSNFKNLGASKPESQILCKPCQVEFGLRNIEGGQSSDYRIFFHLIPDYFYTPESWSLAENIVQEIGNGKLQLERIAEKVIGDEFTESDDYLGNMADDDGWDVLHSTMGEFKNNFGVQILEYQRSNSGSALNDTSVHFLSIFTGLLTAQISGSRAVISEKPVNTDGSNFDEMVKIDCGKSQVLSVTGETVSIQKLDEKYGGLDYSSELEAKLKAFASLIRLGYGVERKDSLFAKYLRVCRNNELPGSKLLKMIVRDQGPGNAGYHLREAEVVDKILGDTMTENKLDHLSELGYRIAIPKSYKAYAVERPFREAVKAVTKTDNDLGKEDYKNLVSGRLRKGLERTDQTFSRSKDDLDTEKGFGERVDEFADFFVDEIFYGLCDGKPGKMKRKSNNFADAYYSGILKRKNNGN
ncbi:type I-D CRISPR-associated protein Cas10d/Csc3 [Candidatus Nanohalococcus occultus]|uniref:type I-D CRISPR-associated protein Cas10d/Csc3 n=1 Tax=Candidatus Nanohalococcus occultus TaxID=2978047 RepID=UPI0039DFCD95